MTRSKLNVDDAAQQAFDGALESGPDFTFGPDAFANQSGLALAAPALQSPAADAPVVQSPTPNLTISWAGVTQFQAGGSTPPDSNLAAGTKNIITVVNDHIDIYNKSGSNLSSQSLNTLFGSSDFIFDPRVMWDQFSGRFIATADDHTGSNSSLHIAVSVDSNPLDGWYFYNYNVNNAGNWLDYPVLGLDATSIYLSGNYFTPGTTYVNSGVWAINKTALENGQSAQAFLYNPAAMGAPFTDLYTTAHMYGTEAGLNGDFAVEYGQNNGGADTLRVIRMENAASGSVTYNFQSLNVGDISDANTVGAPQPGTATLLDDGDNRIQNAVWRNNKLYAVTEIRIGSGASAHDVVHWFVVDTSNLNGLTLLSQGNIDYGANTATYYGNLTVDSVGDMIIGFSFSSSTIFASSAYAEIGPGGTGLQDSGIFLTQGTGTYTDNVGNRWGDYSGVAIDPTDNSSFWVFNQYATSSNSWATTIGGHLGPVVVSGSHAPNDFNGDGTSDIFWRSANGTLADWSMSGATITNSANVAAAPDSSWNIAGTSDFNGDGRTDILWRNTNGTLADWTMNGATILTSSSIAAAPDASWSVAGTGDFNGDGKADIFWRNTNGTLADWTMNGATITTSGTVAAAPDASWSIAGVGDFNGDGRADLLWRNTNGTLAVWSMNGATISASGIVAAAPDASWSVAGIGDFNGDGNADILWRNTSGALAEWLMNGSTITSSQTIAAAPNATWSIVEVGDLNGDGKADILWRNTAGTLAEWTMNGATISASNFIAASPDSTWQTQAKPTDYA